MARFQDTDKKQPTTRAQEAVKFPTRELTQEQEAQLRAKFPPGTQLVLSENSEYARVVLDFFKNKHNEKIQVLLGVPGDPPSTSIISISSLQYAHAVATIDQSTVDHILKIQEAKRMAIVATAHLRHERSEGSPEDMIPYLHDNKDLRYKLLNEISGMVSPLLRNHPVEMETIIALVKDFFDRRKQSSNSPKEKEGQDRPTRPKFPAVLAQTRRVDFYDTHMPQTVNGIDGTPVQLVMRDFIAGALEKLLGPHDTRPVSPAEVKRWCFDNLTAYPIQAVSYSTESGVANRAHAYVLSDVIRMLKESPLRAELPRLDKSGRALIDLAGQQVEVVSAEGLREGRMVSIRVVQGALSNLGMSPIPHVQLKEPTREYVKNVYRATEVDRTASIFLSQEGVAIPIGNHPLPYGIALPLATYAPKLGEANLFKLESQLREMQKKPIKIDALGVAHEKTSSPGGRSGRHYHEASVPNEHVKRILMTDRDGTLLVHSGDSLNDVEPLYWLEDLEKLTPSR